MNVWRPRSRGHFSRSQQCGFSSPQGDRSSSVPVCRLQDGTAGRCGAIERAPPPRACGVRATTSVSVVAGSPTLPFACRRCALLLFVPGSLTFDSSTARDAAALAWLMSVGASLACARALGPGGHAWLGNERARAIGGFPPARDGSPIRWGLPASAVFLRSCCLPVETCLPGPLGHCPRRAQQHACVFRCIRGSPCSARGQAPRRA